MNYAKLDGICLYDFSLPSSNLFEEVTTGLSQPQKTLPSKLFYDEKGSKLYDEITQLEEYYPTRAEISIIKTKGKEIAAHLGSHCELVEFGSGSSTKTRTLLDHMIKPVSYVPIDISREHLIRSASAIAHAYPSIQVSAVCADFTKPFDLPASPKEVKHLSVYHPGSTIGNYSKAEATQHLQKITRMCKSGSSLILSVDLKKNKETLERAYNDKRGVTAQFNINILTHINRELQANFSLENFKHVAFYNEEKGRIEMHLESLQDQSVTLQNVTIHFREGETIHTESSYKYTLEEVYSLANAAGMAVHQHWTDEKGYFSVNFLSVR